MCPVNLRTDPEDDLAGSTVPSPARASPQGEANKMQELCQCEQTARWPVQHRTVERSMGLVQREQRRVRGSQTHISQDTGRGGTDQCGKGCSLSRARDEPGREPVSAPKPGISASIHTAAGWQLQNHRRMFSSVGSGHAGTREPGGSPGIRPLRAGPRWHEPRVDREAQSQPT